MDHTQIIADLRAEIEAHKQQIEDLKSELKYCSGEVTEIRQRLELRNLSLERLQAQFTLAADAVNKLLKEREAIRRSRWAKIGGMLGFLPRLGDDFP